MSTKVRWIRLEYRHRIVAVALVFALAGCTVTRQGRVGDSSGFLGRDAELLQEQSGEPMRLGYINEHASWPAYDKVLLEPVTLWAAAEDDFVNEPEDRIHLVSKFYQFLHQELSKDYEMVEQQSPGTLRLRVAIAQADKPALVLDIVTSAVPQTRLLRTVGGYITGKPAFTGAIQIEFRMNDAVTGELLGAGIDKRVGATTLLDSFDSWSEIEDAMSYYAQSARYRLCRQRGTSGCAEPRSKRTL